MPIGIDRNEVQRLVAEEQGQLVEVLPAPEFKEEHLPGAAQEPSGGDLARRDVPTCFLADDLHEVRQRVRESLWETCMVVNEQGIVLGRLGRKALCADSDQTVEAAMMEGPSTVRPSIGGSALLERMIDNGLTSFVVTTADGKLVGVVLREEAEKVLAQH
jgi:Mg/Co/Ni transporter MgtE